MKRLERSLIYNGYAGQLMMFDDYPSGSPSHLDNPYAFKIYAIEHAINSGYKILLHLDASFWAIKNPATIFDIINEKGVFAFRTGYNMAQTSSDKALQWAGITRDEAELLPEYASGAVGLNLDNPNGKKVYELWKEGMEFGLFINSREYNSNDSSDYRFLHARQDQTVWSLAIHKCGLNMDYQDYISYYGTGRNEDKCIFLIGGI